MDKAHLLTDEFTDNTVGPMWTAVGNPGPVTERIRETNQRLEIRPRPFQTGDQYSYLKSTAQYDLTDSRITVEVVQALSAPVGARTFLSAYIDSTHVVAIVIWDGKLRAGFINGFNWVPLADVAYDPQKHRVLLISHQSNTLAGGTAGTVTWSVSPNGEDFTTLAAQSVGFAITSLNVAIGAGTTQPVAEPGFAVLDNFNGFHVVPRVRTVEERRLSARDVRVEAAQLAAERLHLEQMNNNDEVNYPSTPLVGNFSKSLKHDALGDPDPASYGTLLRALESRDFSDFEEIQLATATTAKKLTNPQAGLTFDILGPDPQEVTIPPAPRFDSQVTADEMGELYWMALARDVAFVDYEDQAAMLGSPIQEAVQSLNEEFPAFGGTLPVTHQNLFRGIYPGEQVGPYVSQFLLKGNNDPRKPDGMGRDANEGYIAYGSQVIDQRQLTVVPQMDYLTDFSWWLDVQNGADKRGQDVFDPTRRFIRNLRDGTNYVHFDQVINAWYNTAWILLTEPMGNQLVVQPGVTGRPGVDLEFLKNPGNPYDPPAATRDSRTQIGFATFGPPHVIEVLTEVLGRALRAVWYQKWMVHRRLRPEEYGGRVHNQLTGARSYPLYPSITSSLADGLLARFFGGQDEGAFPTFLLPQAFPEGAPTHPAYGAGHATGSGACATILKAFFAESAQIKNPVLSSADGLSLVPYGGSEILTVGGELNKLAGNIALFRNAAGVHWRSDYTFSLELGEAVAIRLLQELSLGYNEKDAFFQFTRFDGTLIRIEDGRILGD